MDSSIEKHMNSKLFQKFLSQQNIKNPSKPATKPSPEKEKDKELKREDSELLCHSERIQPGMSYVFYDEELPTERPIQHPPSPPPPVYDPLQDPIVLEHLAVQENRHKNEIQSLKNEYEDMLDRKDEEIRALQRDAENYKMDLIELQDRLENGGDLDRKLKQLKSENKALEQKETDLYEQTISLKKQLESSRYDLEMLRSQYEDLERGSRNKQFEVERELRSAKENLEEIERQLIRSKDKNSDLERKLAHSKDKSETLRDELLRSSDKMQRLERELVDTRDQQSYDSKQMYRENETLKRQIDNLTRSLERLDERQIRISQEVRNRYEEPKYEEKYHEPRYSDRNFDMRFDDRNFDRFDDRNYERFDDRNYDKFDDRNYGKFDDRNYDKFDDRNYDKFDDRNYERFDDRNNDFRLDDRNKFDYDERNNRGEEQNPSMVVRSKIGAHVSHNVGNALVWEEKEKPPPPSRTQPVAKPDPQESVQVLENQLLNLQIEKKRVEDEFSKLPEHAKKISALRRREELEEELRNLNSRISTLKTKLRKLGQLH